MALEFQRGTRGNAKGHALLYFRDARNPGGLLATYLVILPVAMQVAKYMPPFLAAEAAAMRAKELSAVALPPVPEQVESLHQIQAMAEGRDDDLLFGGDVDPDQATRALEAVNEIMQKYAQAYQEHLDTLLPSAALVDTPSGAGVTEVLYQLQSDRDKLGELAKLIGKLRFALEGRDTALLKEVEEELAVLVRYIPDKYRMERVLQAARQPTGPGAELAQLYLDWCYKLAAEEYQALQPLEERIRAMEQRAPWLDSR